MDRLSELLAAEAVNDLSSAERAELERLLAAEPEARAEREAMMRAARLVRIALAAGPMPGRLRERLARRGEAWQAGRETPTAD